MVDHWTKIFIFVVVLASSSSVDGEQNIPINITFIPNAVEKGAVCLDGTPGGYFHEPGFGDGADRWIVYLQGGGWCRSSGECIDRTKKELGTTKHLSNFTFGSSTSAEQNINPDFYNWNKVYIPYCDGASYIADVEEVDPNDKIYRRGARIFKGVMEDLVAKGMNNAKYGLLEGNSAGGLATMLNCDRFHSYFPASAIVKCVADSGFFIHAQDDVPGLERRERLFYKVTDYHQLSNVLPKTCTSRVNNASLCMFPINFIQDIKTPLFVLNSFFDSYQIGVHMDPPANNENFVGCQLNINECNSDDIAYMRIFRTGLLKEFNSIAENPSRGTYFSSCYIHDFLYRTDSWTTTPVLEDKTISKAIGDWYFDRSRVRLVDPSDTPALCIH